LIWDRVKVKFRCKILILKGAFLLLHDQIMKYQYSQNNKFMKRNNFFLAILAIIFITACSAEKKYDATIPVETTASDSPFTHLPGPSLVAEFTEGEGNPLLTESGIDKELVCMVNNAYMGKKQFPVEFGDKLYYGCCEMCVNTIQNEAHVRTAKDPVSGNEVDKSEAYIALEPGNIYGGVLYFESEANYKKFMSI